MSENLNNIMNMLEEAKLEYQLDKLTKEMEVELLTNEIFMEHIDIEYEDKLRDMDLINKVNSKLTNLTKLSTRINDVEQEAIKINSQELFWKCESRKAQILNQMSMLREKYSL
jgi:hypothetical protein